MSYTKNHSKSNWFSRMSLANKSFLIIMGPIILFIVGYFVLQLAHRVEAWYKVTVAIDAIPNNQELVYKDVRDQGCSSSIQGWLGTTTTCSYGGRKYFKGKNNEIRDLKTMDTLLQSLGYRPIRAIDTKLLEEQVKERGQYNHPYSQENSALQATVIYYDPQFPRSKSKYQPLSEALGVRKDIQISNDEYIYGVYIRHAYSHFENFGF